jgi:hypothetical protein
MQEDFDDRLQVEVLANLLKMDKAESKQLLETLAIRLQSVMPEIVTIKRGGWLLSAERPVQQLTIRFDDCHLQLMKDKTGTMTASIMKIVRGVILKTTPATADDWIKTLATELSKAANNNAQTREALSKFMIG